MRFLLIICFCIATTGCINFALMSDCHNFKDCVEHPKPTQSF